MTGVINGADSTFQTGDTINGSGSTNTVKVTNVTNTSQLVDINNVGAVNVTLASSDGTLDALLYTGVGAVNAVNSTANTLNVANGELATVYGVKNTAVAAGINVDIRDTDLTGANDTINFAVNTAGYAKVAASGNVARVAVLTSADAGIENIALSFEGANNVRIDDNAVAATDYVGFAVTGAGTGTIDVQNLTNVESFDLSATTGANTLQFAAGLQTGTEVLAGTGTSTVRVTEGALSTVSNLDFNGVDILRLNTGSTGNARLNFAVEQGFTTVRVDGDAAETNTITLSKAGSIANINFVGDGLTANAGANQQFRNLAVLNSFTDGGVVNVAVGNNGTTLQGGVDFVIAGLTANGAEGLDITVSDTAASGTTTFTAGITGNALSAIAVTTAGDVNLGTITATESGTAEGMLSEIDLSGVTGTSAQSSLVLDTNTVSSSLVITGAAGGTAVSQGGAFTEQAGDSIEFTGSNAADSVVMDAAFLGNLTAYGLGGADTLTGGADSDYLSGGDGADTLSGQNGEDEIIGGAGADSITGGNGSDVLTGGTGANDFIQTLIYNVAATAVQADTITDFSIAKADQVGNFGLANLANVATLTRVAAATTDVANNDAVATAAGTISAAFDLGGVAAATNLLLTNGNYASAAAVQADLRAFATAGSATTDAEGFLIAWDNGVDTKIGVVDYNAIEADGDLITAAVVTEILTLSGVADNTTLTAASGSWLAFVS